MMTDQAFYALPTFIQKLRWKLGYRWHRMYFDEEVPGCPYWAKTTVCVQFSFMDRLRLLLTGRVELDVEQRTDVQIGQAVSKTSVRVLAPTQDFSQQ